MDDIRLFQPQDHTPSKEGQKKYQGIVPSDAGRQIEAADLKTMSNPFLSHESRFFDAADADVISPFFHPISQSRQRCLRAAKIGICQQIKDADFFFIVHCSSPALINHLLGYIHVVVMPQEAQSSIIDPCICP